MFAEPLESNAGLKKLQSAALPLNLLAMHIESTPLPTTSPHPALTAATPSIAPIGGWSDLLAPARLRLAANDIGNEAMRAIKTAASISLELELCKGSTIWGSRDPTSMPPSPGNSGRNSAVR